MARSLVTGGSGFIGSNLALYLEAQGHEVCVVDYSTSQSENLRGFTGECRTVDVARGLSFDGRFDFVFHQASLTDPRYANDQQMYDANISGFKHVVQFCQEKGARLIYASTAGLYGNGPTPMREDQPKEILTVYGRSKFEMDQRAEILGRDFPVVGLRYFNVYGPREAHKGRPASMILHLATQMREGRPPRIFKHGEQVRDHIYVKDVARANLLAASAPSGVYNVGSGVGTSFNELVNTLNEILRTDFAPEYFDMPYDPKTYQHNTVADTRLAKEKLHFEAKWSLKDGVRDYLSTIELI